MPLSGPVIATAAILKFLFMYNQYLWPLMVVQEESIRPVMVGLGYFTEQLNVPWGEVMAYLTIITVPVLAIYLSLQRVFIASVASTGTGSMSGAATQRSKAGRSPIPVTQLIELAERQGRLDDPVVRQELARLHAGERIVAWLGARSGMHPSIGKLWRTRQGRAAADLAARLAFPASPAWGRNLDDGPGAERNREDDYFAYHILNCRGMSLGGGTDEIQRNTLGERALGLPREPGPDRNTPFRDLLNN